MSKRTEALLGKMMDRDMKRGAKVVEIKPLLQPLPKGPFGLIYADPPWRVETYSDKGRNRLPDGDQGHYQTMSLAEMMGMPVADVAAKDCMLLMWIIDTHLEQALELGKAWGFTYKTTAFYWAKLRKLGADGKPGRDPEEPEKAFPTGMGYWTRANPELCLLFTRGKPVRIDKGVPKLIPFGGIPKQITANRREHSRKPDEVYARIERLIGDVPKLELFARTTAPGWEVWGNETAKFPARSKERLLG